MSGPCANRALVPPGSPHSVLVDSEDVLIIRTLMGVLCTVFNYHPGIVIRNKDFSIIVSCCMFRDVFV